MNATSGLSDGMQMVFAVVGVVMMILWGIVPFAVFALNDKARKMEKLLREIRDLEQSRASKDRNAGRF
jgi:biopolymer transport protein ExbB/TolQ